MCGIVGILYRDAARPAADLSAALDAIRHRGPDDSGVYTDGPLAMGMTRLSIIDLAGGHQPMSDVSGRYWIVFNGEIYNYPELRDDLAARGYPFCTASDTEVILAGYVRWGDAVVERLNGMFAFALWDRDRRRLFLARDRIGVKPLYYTQHGGAFRFASEIKALLVDPDVPRQISRVGLANYLSYGHALAPDTMFEGVDKLLPGHQLVCQDGAVAVQPYWRVPTSEEPRLEPLDEAIRQSMDLLEDAIRIHMIADVPVGAFLSGGLDSATIVAHMTRLAGRVKTFSIGFDDAAHNELATARMLARHYGTEHYEATLTAQDLPPLLEKLVYHYDEPFGDAAGFPTLVVSRLAREHVKVVLTGDGGDELFGGYQRYLAERQVPWVQRVPRPVRQIGLLGLRPVPGQHRLKRILSITLQGDPATRYANWALVFRPDERERVLTPDCAAPDYDIYGTYRRYYEAADGLDPVNRAMYTDLHTRLPDAYLEKVDKATMATSLEARVPFLDYRLIELAQRIPSRFKVSRRDTKTIFRQAVADLVPREILHLPKHGFSVPTRPWFRGELSRFVQDVLTDPRAARRGVFRPEVVQAFWDDHQTGRGVYDTHLWLLFNFELWARCYLDGEGVAARRG